MKQLNAFGYSERENLIVNEITQLMETIKDGSTVQVGLIFYFNRLAIYFPINNFNNIIFS